MNQWYVSTGHDGSVPIATVRSETDDAVTRFRAIEADFRNADIGASAMTSLEKVDAGLAQLDEERNRIERTDLDVVTPPLLLLAVDDNLLEFGQEVARNLHDTDIAASVTGVLALEQEQTQLAREASALIPVLATGEETGYSTWLRSIAAEARNRQQFLATASVEDLAAFQSTVSKIESTPNLLRPSDPAQQLPSAFPIAPNIDTPAHYFTEYQQQSTNLDRAIEAVDRSIAARSAVQASDARRDVWLYGGATVFAMLFTIALIWIVARAVIRPLRKLTESAREMSQKQLPQLVESMRAGGEVDTFVLPPIEINSADEIGELAAAFNDIEAVTVQVARDQAQLLRKGMGDLFVNLARRNQSLLERQLELLDELERNEHDPAALDALFKLDHMATRMRRNAESLLVLSGAEQPRQWQQPIGLLDVVRSASAEIADFPRVDLVGVDDQLAVSGRAVADLAHLLAELLENATSFSPPDAAVVVSGANTAQGFAVAISDQGIGMPPEQIAEANQLLAKPPVVGLALSRALGFHVVASLAARHGIKVELRPGAPIGLVALVTLPAAILEPRGRARGDTPRVHPAPRARRPAHHARCAPRGLAPARRASGGGVARRGSGRPRAPADAPGAPDAPGRRDPAAPHATAACCGAAPRPRAARRPAPPLAARAVPTPPPAPPMEARPVEVPRDVPRPVAPTVDVPPFEVPHVEAPPMNEPEPGATARGATARRARRRRAVRRRAAPGPRPRPPPEPPPDHRRRRRGLRVGSVPPLPGARVAHPPCPRQAAWARAEHDDDVPEAPSSPPPPSPEPQSSDPAPGG